MKIGVTERGDAGLDLSWVSKLYPANIIISKELTSGLVDSLINNKDCIIFHMTCTGFGGSIVEPNVPIPEHTHDDVMNLIEKGFPVSHIVLRVDPIIPTNKGTQRTKYVLELFKDSGIKRVRFSFLDMYPHVVKRFIAAGIPVPYNSFTASKEMQDNALKMLSEYETQYELESCAEETKYKLGCVSKKDFDILGLEYSQEDGGFQRRGCLCCSGKTELLSSKTQCAHKCLYCYWK